MRKEMKRKSKIRLAVVSAFFAVVTATLCGSIYEVIASGDIKAELLYLFSLLAFLVKYYVDDLVDNECVQLNKTNATSGNNSPPISGSNTSPAQDDQLNEKEVKRELTRLSICWIMLLLSSLFTHGLTCSAAFWVLGLLLLTKLLFQDKESLLLETRCAYISQNIIIIALLVAIFFLSFASNTFVTYPCLVPMRNFFVIIIFIYNSCILFRWRPFSLCQIKRSISLGLKMHYPIIRR